MTIWMDRLIKPSPTNEPPASDAQFHNDLAVAVTVLFALFLAPCYYKHLKLPTTYSL